MLAIITLRMPAAAITSASETLPQVTPMAPAATCWRAIVGDLWHFMCGRHCLPRAAMNPAIATMFRSMADKSRHKRGVSRSSFCEPISGCMREVSKDGSEIEMCHCTRVRFPLAMVLDSCCNPATMTENAFLRHEEES